VSRVAAPCSGFYVVATRGTWHAKFSRKGRQFIFMCDDLGGSAELPRRLVVCRIVYISISGCISNCSKVRWPQ